MEDGFERALLRDALEAGFCIDLVFEVVRIENERRGGYGCGLRC